MTRSHTYPIICPQCLHEQDFTAYTSINISQNPELRPKVMSTALFDFQCDACAYRTVIDHGYLYHDADRAMMVYYEPKMENHVQIAQDIRTTYFKEEAYDQAKISYRFRIVPELRDLWEKISIFEAGLDDRAIELLKYYIRLTFLSQYPEAEVERIQFYVDEESKQKQFILMQEDDIVAFVAFDFEHYDLILQRWATSMKQSATNLQLMVNADWAKRLVQEA